MSLVVMIKVKISKYINNHMRTQKEAYIWIDRYGNGGFDR